MRNGEGREVLIPFVNGEIIMRGLVAGQQGGAIASPGRWALSPRSTVPFVEIANAHYGTRSLTWGETVEIPEGSTGAIKNASAHSGDVVLVGMGSGLGMAPRAPGSVAVPCQIVTNGGNFQTSVIDTRMARRAYLCLIAVAGQVLTYVVNYQGQRGALWAPGSAAALAGAMSYTQNIYGFGDMIPLGIGSGQNRDGTPSDNSASELRPMALLDSLYVTFSTTNNANVVATTNAFYLLEY